MEPLRIVEPKPIDVKSRRVHSHADKVSVRLARNDEGNEVSDLVNKSGFKIDGLDWSNIHPFWLVATDSEDKIVGCVQVCISRPIGMVELLSIDLDVTPIERAVIVKSLLIAATLTLKKGGAQLASGMVPFEMKAYKKILKKRGCVTIASGNLMVKRL